MQARSQKREEEPCVQESRSVAGVVVSRPSPFRDTVLQEELDVNVRKWRCETVGLTS